MTSIIDQYENEKVALQISQKGKTTSITELTSQYSLSSLEVDSEGEDVPIFSMSVLKSVPSVTSRLQRMTVGGDYIVFLTANNMLIYLNYKGASKPKEIDINKTLGSSYKVNQIFLDPMGGHHILLSVSTYSNVNFSPPSSSSTDHLFYCNAAAPNLKFKQIEKMKNHKVTAVAWNRIAVTPQCTAPILVGTSKGLIFEMKLNAESDKLFQASVETYCKDVFDIGRGLPTPITGMEFFKFSNAADRYFVIITTVNRLYQFVGSVSNVDDRPSLAQIFDDYLKIPEGFAQVPNLSKTSYSQVHFIRTVDEIGKVSVVPKSFAWHVSGIGIIHRQIQLEWRKGLTEVLIQNHVIEYSPVEQEPITFVLTDFHVLLLYPDRVETLSVLNGETVFVEYSDVNNGKFLDMYKDLDGNIWILSERIIHKGRFNKEDRFVWKIYLDMKKFPLAKEYCRTNIYRLHKVMKKEAEFYFDKEMYEESASLYSQIDGIRFEEIALKFLQAWQVEALKLYLMKMLEKLKVHESAHITMITFWLFEIYEKQLADAKYNSASASEQRQLQSDFETLLSLPHVHNCVKTNKEVTYRLLNSHGDTENLIRVAYMLKDYEKVVRQYMEEGKVNDALNILKDESVSFAKKNLISSFMPKFISLAPKDTVDVLIKLGRSLEPLSILPSLIFPYDNDIQAGEIIRYLEYSIHSLHSHDEAIHNYLITLYAKYKPEKVMRYLATQGHERSEINYEVRYALKLCQEYGLTEACVQLSALLGLWESAVDLALSVDVELAKQTVPQTTTENVELCKKLWLRIAEHVVQESKNIKKVMEFLQQCDLIKIEDILPFFDDFVTIDYFKDAICSSLQEYNQNIEVLKDEMNDATKSADEIRTDVQSFKCRYSVIQSSDLCCSCNIQLLIRPFYVFPCSHCFHTDCLIFELKPHLNELNVKKIETLQRQLADITLNVNNEDITSTSSNSQSLKEQLKSELDAFLASECFFCGTIAIEAIDKPFIEDDEFERIRSDWE